MNARTSGPLVDAGLLVLRIAIAMVFIFHGAQKLLGVWGGPGLSGFAGHLRQMNIPAPALSAGLAACAEFFGGLMVLLGIFPRLAAIPMLFTMLVAINVTRANGFSMQNRGYEFALLMALLLVALMLTGGGRFVFWKPRRRAERGSDFPAGSAPVA